MYTQFCPFSNGRGNSQSFYGDRYEGYSAGVTPTKVNPYVVKSMTEIGIDISRNRSKTIEEFREENFNYVVTVCDGVREACPFFPEEEIVHKSFKDLPSSRTLKKKP